MSVLQLPSHSFSGDFDASNDVFFDIIHSQTDAIRTYSEWSSSALFNWRKHAQIDGNNFSISSKVNENRFQPTPDKHWDSDIGEERAQNSQGEPPVFHNNNIVIVTIIT